MNDESISMPSQVIVRSGGATILETRQGDESGMEGGAMSSRGPTSGLVKCDGPISQSQSEMKLRRHL